MTISFSITRKPESDQATASIVLADGTMESISHLHTRFEEIVAALKSPDHDEDAIAVLINPGRYIGPALTSVSDRFTYVAGGSILFDGERIDPVLETVILDRLHNGDDEWSSLAKFAVLLDENPSQQSREHLYQFIKHNGLQITTEGWLVAYKGVQNTEDNLSVHAGPHCSVDGVLLPAGHVPNVVGTTVSIPRAKVNDNRAIGCSNGLHAGSWNYASGFGSKTLTVEIHPANVVSVPDDCQNQKLRVCEYNVIDVTEDRHFGSTVSWTHDNEVEEEDYDEDAYDEQDGEEDVDLDYSPIAPVEVDDEALEALRLKLSAPAPHDWSGISSLAEIANREVRVKSLLDGDLGQSETAREINEITSAFGFTTTRDSVRRYRTRA